MGDFCEKLPIRELFLFSLPCVGSVQQLRGAVNEVDGGVFKVMADYSFRIVYS